MGTKFGNTNIASIFHGDKEITDVYLGNTQVYSSFEPIELFRDTSGSPGPELPINDLDGNPMFDVDKGVAYYGTVSHTDLFTGDQIASEIGLTVGVSKDNQSVWHKYYWNGGIHFWRKTAKNSISWDSIRNIGAIYGTGTTTSRKGNSNVGSVTQNKEVVKNNNTYIVRLMEGSSVDPTEGTGNNLHNSEFNLILMNLHAATNSGLYSPSPTDGVTYSNWSDTANFTNDDFVGWKTSFGDEDFTTNDLGESKWQQESSSSGTSALRRGQGRLSASTVFGSSDTRDFIGWAPVLTVKHPSFATYGKSGGFNQDEPDWT